MTHVEGMFDAKICCFFAKVLEKCFLTLLSLQPKLLQPDYVSSYDKDLLGKCSHEDPYEEHGSGVSIKGEMPGRV